ncbi:hypothetical protein [Candidatus Lucifugimonas marina]|uniref:LppX_LprAFG lipoprotein n=1 Tax=Candidatus Lucifugimonas marina TaxID=3038979 RepID=A0AAJ6CUC0_9CHLR|nr:hypothetical protein [SAR202 cluster bacterium JH639]WFG40387.1 hypothetical protein GKO48_12480 [SAR202 cluster bacterium JH1073]
MTTHHPKVSKIRQRSILLIALLLAVVATACDDFYTDSLPTPDIAQPTPANVREGDPATVIETAAREALAAQLSIAPADSTKILFEHATWTERSPGCYPAPASITGAYLIPGYRLLMQHDGIFYEYNADQGLGTGALCESTFQLIPAEPAYSIVVPQYSNASESTDYDVIHIVRSEEEVAEFNSTFGDIAQIGVDEIEFPEEVLVGGWVEASPNPDVVRAYLSAEGTSIIIEVQIPEEFEEQANDDWSQIWALVDATEPDSIYEFLVVE